MDGDIIQIPSSQCIFHNTPTDMLANFVSAFTCIHTVKEPRQKVHIFEPTPPERRGYKVSASTRFPLLRLKSALRVESSDRQV